MAIKVIALDLERTLITNVINRHPRNGLVRFLSFCLETFERVVIFTGADKDTTRAVLEELVEKRKFLKDFLERIEIPDWEGEIKDLRMIPDARVEEILIVDDDESYILPDQKDRWYPIEPYEPPGINPWVHIDDQLSEEEREELGLEDRDYKLYELIPILKKRVWTENQIYLNAHPACYEMLVFKNDAKYYSLLPNAEEHFDQLLELNNQDIQGFFHTFNDHVLKDLDVWAVVVFDKTYKLGGHIIQTRDSKFDISIASSVAMFQTTSSEVKHPYRPVHILYINSKNKLEKHASRSPLYGACWEMLKEKPKNRSWLCFPPPLPGDWVAETESGDEALFFELYKPKDPESMKNSNHITDARRIENMVAHKKNMLEDSARGLEEYITSSILTCHKMGFSESVIYYLDRLLLLYDHPQKQAFSCLQNGNLLEYHQRYETAVQVYEKGLEIQYNHPFLESRLMNNLAFCYLTLEQPEKASGLARAALEIDPDQQRGYFNLGMVQEARGQYSQAVESYLTGMSSPLVDHDTYRYTRDIFYRPVLDKKHQSQVPGYPEKPPNPKTRSSKKKPLLPAPARLLVALVMLVENGETKLISEDELQEEIEAEDALWLELYRPILKGMVVNTEEIPVHPEITYRDWLQKVRPGVYQLSKTGRRIFNRYFQITKKLGELQDFQGYLTEEGLFLSDEYLEAAHYYLRSLDRSINRFHEIGAADKAQPLINQLFIFSVTDEDKARSYLKCGAWKEWAKEFRAGIECYEKGLRLEPEEADLRYFLHNNTGYCYNILGENKKAEPLCREAISIEPTYYNAHKNLGLSLAGQGQYYQAFESFKKATELQPGDRRAFDHIGSMLTDQPELAARYPEIQDFYDAAYPMVNEARYFIRYIDIRLQKQFEALSPQFRILLSVAMNHRENIKDPFILEALKYALDVSEEEWKATYQSPFETMCSDRIAQTSSEDNHWRGIFSRQENGLFQFTEFGIKAASFLYVIVDEIKEDPNETQ